MRTTAIHVITLADDAYAMPLAVCIRSLIDNHQSGRSLQITIIDGGISHAHKERLAASWTSESHAGVQWRFMAPSFGPAADLPVWGRIPKLTYARLALHEYVADDVGRLVLLDSDTLVLTDIAPLNDAELAGAVIGATVDPFIPVVSAMDGLSTWRESGLAPDAPYFNAGVMVVDVAAWARERVTEQALDYICGAHNRLNQYDQDSLNAVLRDRWKVLDSRWQTHPRTLNSLGRPVHAAPWIVHFSGRLKPWLYDAGGPWDRRYYEYLDRTAWKGFRPPRSMSARMLRLYDSPLRRAFHPLEMRLLALKRWLEQNTSGSARSGPGSSTR